MKKLASLICFISFGLQGIAQISEEIRTYNDSIFEWVDKGRKLLTDRVATGNKGKVEATYDYLWDLTEDKAYKSFYYAEALYINLYLADWITVEKLIQDIEKLRRMRIPQQTVYILPILYDYLLIEKENILLSLKNTRTDESFSELIQLIFTYLEHDGNSREYELAYKSYREKYPITNYEEFFDHFLPKMPTPGSFSFSFGVGYLGLTENLDKNFSSQTMGAFGFDGSVARWEFSLFMQLNNHILRTPFNTTQNGDTLAFNPGAKFSYTTGGLNLGYTAIRNSHIKITPYISTLGASLKSNLYSVEEEDNGFEEVKLYNTFVLGAGLNLTFKIHEYRPKNPELMGFKKGFFALKSEFGYNKLLSHNYTGFGGDNYYAKLSIVMGFGQF